MAPDDPPTKLRPDSDVRPTREELVSPVQPVRRRAEGVKSQPPVTSTPIDTDKLRASEAQIIQSQVWSNVLIMVMVILVPNALKREIMIMIRRYLHVLPSLTTVKTDQSWS